jgi:hypothetical protein
MVEDEDAMKRTCIRVMIVSKQNRREKMVRSLVYINHFHSVVTG